MSPQESQAPHLRQRTNPSFTGVEDSVEMRADLKALTNAWNGERNRQLDVARQFGLAPEHQFSLPDLHTAQ